MWKSGDSLLPTVCLRNNVSKSHNLLDLKQHNVFVLFVLLSTCSLSFGSAYRHILFPAQVFKPIPFFLGFGCFCHMVPSQTKSPQAPLLRSKSKDCHFHICYNNNLSRGTFKKCTALPGGNSTSLRHWGRVHQERHKEHGHESKYGACVKGLEPHSSPSSIPSQIVGKRVFLGLEDPSEHQTLLHFGVQSSTSSYPCQYTTVSPDLYKEGCNFGVRHAI